MSWAVTGLTPSSGSEWPVRDPRLSQRDASAGSLRELVDTLRARRPSGGS